MPVTFSVVNHPAEPYKFMEWGSKVPSYSQDQVLAGLPKGHGCARVLQSSVDGTQNIVMQKNGFVLGVLLAYNAHHNLVIRPDDVWIAIVSQLNFYINAHAEELRDKFVSHKGKEELAVITLTSFEKMDFGDLAVQMAGQIHKNVKDKLLIPWILPNFSTTTAKDTVICSVLIMSTLKKYFNYSLAGGCGIPFITLEGTQADWQSILDRIQKIPEFGAEPKEWAGMLRAILTRFVHAFDAGGPQADKKFWERIIHEQAGSGMHYLSGWMSAFCAWDKDGNFFSSRECQGAPDDGFHGSEDNPAWVYGLNFDGVWFPRAGSPPEGYAEVDVNLVNLATGDSYDCSMLAGHVGITMHGKEKLDTLHMAPQWFMYVKGPLQNPYYHVNAGRDFRQ
jgi:hypothetical protein